MKRILGLSRNITFVAFLNEFEVPLSFTRKLFFRLLAEMKLFYIHILKGINTPGIIHLEDPPTFFCT